MYEYHRRLMRVYDYERRNYKMMINTQDFRLQYVLYSIIIIRDIYIYIYIVLRCTTVVHVLKP